MFVLFDGSRMRIGGFGDHVLATSLEIFNKIFHFSFVIFCFHTKQISLGIGVLVVFMGRGFFGARVGLAS